MYKEELTRAMTYLGKQDNTRFIGQQIVFPGNPMSTTLENVDKSKMIEVPVFEEVQMGMSLGMAATGLSVITFYPRWDFLISATKDPLSGNLDRLQVVKGWLDGQGRTQERVYDVQWSDKARRQPNAQGKLPAVGNTVDVTTATWSNSIGAQQLSTVWSDPDFDPQQKAFYYVRVLEIPTPRWSTYDAVRYNLEVSDEYPSTIQERAYSSAIWYTP